MESKINTLRVMVVDDDRHVRSLLDRILTLLGARVAVAADGAEALRLFRGQPSFDLVLTDFQMPVMDGLTLACRIKRASPFTPVVLMTGDPRRTVERRAAAGCVDQVLYKPFGVKDLRNALGRLTTDPQIRSIDCVRPAPPCGRCSEGGIPCRPTDGPSSFACRGLDRCPPPC